jgi:hypothetical protein
LPGLIYIHGHDCAPCAEHARFPDEPRFIALALNAYAPGRWLIGYLRIDDGQVKMATWVPPRKN